VERGLEEEKRTLFLTHLRYLAAATLTNSTALAVPAVEAQPAALFPPVNENTVPGPRPLVVTGEQGGGPVQRCN